MDVKELTYERMQGIIAERDALRAELSTLKAWKEAAEKQEPRSYLYRYTDPMSGNEVWRSSPFEWNGQLPGASMPLFALPIPPAQSVPEDFARDAERYRWLRNPSTDVGLVLDKVVGRAPYDEGTGTGGHWLYEYRAGEDLDKAVDAAMLAAAPKPEVKS